jgi:hypothetical protein
MMTVRIVLLSTAIVLALGTAACAAGPRTDMPTYQAELNRLSAECTERGGILIPSGNHSARPQTDYACRINGGASRLPRN